MPRSSSIASTSASGMSAYQSYDLTEESDSYYYDRDDDLMRDGAHTPSKSSESEDPAKSATELNSLADQLEHLSSMLRVQSDARRKRPRLCYRCRQKGHMASDCPLPADATVPTQQPRERMGLASPHPPHTPSPRSNTVSSSPSALPWRASSVALYNNIVGSRNGTQSSRNASGSVTPNRRNTQSGSVSIVTGSAQGIGKCLAEALVSRGGKVVLGDIQDKGSDVADELNAKYGMRVAVFHKCDVRSPHSLQALVSQAVGEFGTLDIFINAASTHGTTP
ncbi:hypothetical protein GGI18_005822, partial [Coemansia linderi]